MKFSELHSFLSIGFKALSRVTLIATFLLQSPSLNGQENHYSISKNFFKASDSLDRTRVYTLSGIGLLAYSSTSYALYHAWYKDYPLGPFHFFDDRGEWENMDKVGHFFTAWMTGYGVDKLSRWSGVDDRSAIYTGILAGTLFQTTIEVMDGFSEKWGFSVADIGANIGGTAFYALQEYYWKEQKMVLKFSSFPKSYSSDAIYPLEGPLTSSLKERSEELFGRNLAQRTLKDYNAQSYWISVHPEDLFGEFGFPDWLNIAFGYSPENVYGGFSNNWQKQGSTYYANDSHPRYHQFLISPDINWNKIETESHFLKTLFSLLNLLKVPAPALEVNDRDGVRLVFHWIYF